MGKRKELSAEELEWERKLGMPAELPRESGRRVKLGTGLGAKTDQEEVEEDDGTSHSRMCPINLGYALNDEIDQPNDRPTEAAASKKKK